MLLYGTVGVSTTGHLPEMAGIVVGVLELHENVTCPTLPSVTFTGVAKVFGQNAVIDPPMGTPGCVCWIRTVAATSPTATKIASKPTSHKFLLDFSYYSPDSDEVCGILSI